MCNQNMQNPYLEQHHEGRRYKESEHKKCNQLKSIFSISICSLKVFKKNQYATAEPKFQQSKCAQLGPHKSLTWHKNL